MIAEYQHNILACNAYLDFAVITQRHGHDAVNKKLGLGFRVRVSPAFCPPPSDAAEEDAHLAKAAPIIMQDEDIEEPDFSPPPSPGPARSMPAKVKP